MPNFIGMVYGTLKKHGIDTSRMSTQEAIKKFNELQSGSADKSKSETKEESKNSLQKAVFDYNLNQRDETFYKCKNKKVDETFNQALSSYTKNEQNDNIIKNLNKLGFLSIERGNKNSFMPSERKITLSTNSDEFTVFHEIGHYIDYSIGQIQSQGEFSWESENIGNVRIQTKQNLKNSIPETLLEKSQAIANNLLKAVQEYVDSDEFQKQVIQNIAKKYGTKWNTLSGNIKNSLVDDELNKLAQKKLSEVAKRDKEFSKWARVCDIYDAITDGVGYGNKKLLTGHGADYYSGSIIAQKREGKCSLQNTEIFANFIVLKLGNFEEQLSYLKQTSPELSNNLENLFNKVSKYMKEK